MTYSDHVALILLCAFLLVVVATALVGVAMLVSDWRRESRHRRHVTAIINISRF